MVLDITLITVGPQLDIFAICLYIYTRYNTDWIANTEIGLDPSNSLIKRLRYINDLSAFVCLEHKSIHKCIMIFCETILPQRNEYVYDGNLSGHRLIFLNS